MEGLPRGFRIEEIAGRKPQKQYPEGRKCSICGANLSTYNPESVCWPCQERKCKVCGTELDADNPNDLCYLCGYLRKLREQKPNLRRRS